MMRKLFLLSCVLVSFVLTFPLSLFAIDKPFDHSMWDQFLKKFVNEQGYVDYQAAEKDPALLHDYLKQLAKINFHDFNENWPREEKLAIWLNAYHAGVVRIILDHYPLKSIQQVSGVWDLPVVRIGSKRFSLNEIRNNELLGVFRDEKIHLALACGAKSCPRFRAEAYTGPRVEGQLYLATREFVNDSLYNQIEPGKNKIWISRIFKWYAADFKLDFGSPENILKLSQEEAAVLSFIAHYLDDSQKVEFLEEGKYKIKYFPFEWDIDESHKVSA